MFRSAHLVGPWLALLPRGRTGCAGLHEKEKHLMSSNEGMQNATEKDAELGAEEIKVDVAEQAKSAEDGDVNKANA